MLNTIMEFIVKYAVYLMHWVLNYLPEGLDKFMDTFKGFWHLDTMNVFQIANCFRKNWGYFLTVLLAFHVVYLFVGMFFTRKFGPAKHNHKYAILIAARNEETVIGNLLDSIHKQDYPSKLITIFVVADNCTDHTAEIVRKKGAVCYERFDNEHRTKGFALQFLFEKIEEDYGRQSFEGYFIFDADNLLKKDYITRMNESFDEGEKIITSYRNTKNLDENWISASYALHWLRSIRANHRARSVFRLATNIQGTGFLFTNEIVKDGWKYTSLTEDRALTADAVVQGYRISYNDMAEFYDEQPVSLRVALRQRIRWAKGHILAFVESGWGLFKNIFTAKGFRNKFMSYDMLLLITPSALFSMARVIIVDVLYIYVYMNKGFWVCLWTVIWWRLGWRISNHIPAMCMAVYVFITERGRIKKISLWKKIWYSIMWPFFDIIGAWSLYIALFTKVTWKPIPHKSKINIEDVNEGITDSNKK
ncbi:MAG: glycosyltransferase family 2 protein [Bacillota bacterium]|nr:glycosyltransferase family 2 protein [Bacillota bacterium]